MIDLYYGLRNLSVGDEEQTRIMDLVDEVDDIELQLAVRALVQIGEYTTAYEVALRQTFLRLMLDREAGAGDFRAHVAAGAADWVASWNDEQGYSDGSTPSTRAGAEPDDALTVEELMAVYDDIMARR